MVQTVCVRGPGREGKSQPPNRPQRAADVWKALQLLPRLRQGPGVLPASPNVMHLRPKAAAGVPCPRLRLRPPGLIVVTGEGVTSLSSHLLDRLVPARGFRYPTPCLQLWSILPAPEGHFHRVTRTPASPTSLWGREKTHGNSGRLLGSSPCQPGPAATGCPRASASGQDPPSLPAP